MIVTNQMVFEEIKTEDFLPKDTVVWLVPYKGCPFNFWKKGITQRDSSEHIIVSYVSFDKEIKEDGSRTARPVGKRFLVKEINDSTL